MSQNLTQPEEIDHVLMLMAGLDRDADAAIFDKDDLTGNSIYQGELHEDARTASHSQVAQH